MSSFFATAAGLNSRNARRSEILHALGETDRSREGSVSKEGDLHCTLTLRQLRTLILPAPLF